MANLQSKILMKENYMNKLLDKLDSIWKNLLFGLALSFFVIFNSVYDFFYGNHKDITNLDYIAFGVFFILIFHLVLLLFLCIRNIVLKNTRQAIGYIMLIILLLGAVSLCCFSILLMGLGGVYTDEYQTH
jgi:membrane protease YdiL (CAAX protease family)